jgi:glutamate synthase (ferredoxin)
MRRLLENHARYTNSTVAKAILADWDKELTHFVKVMPIDYRNALSKATEIEEQVRRVSQRQTAK